MEKDKRKERINPVQSESDPLTEILREGARRMPAQAIEAEVEDFLARHEQLKDEAGRQRLVRNGYLPARSIQSGIGAVAVEAPRVRDRGGKEERIRFHSGILPPYLRRTKSLEDLLPWLYLKGVSTGDFPEALTALVGPEAAGLSPGVISRLKAKWQEELAEWRGRDLSHQRYVYFWVDGIYFSIRAEDERECVLVVVGATAEGRKELLALQGGFRESEVSWKELLLGLRDRGLTEGPELAVGDGSLGFWKALPQVYGETRWQRCWVHKTVNVLDKLPKSWQARAKAGLHDIWMAPSRAEAEKAFDRFAATYGAKYPKAVECLANDRAELLAFYDFPAEHWTHLRTTNPIESTFATVRHRTVKTRGCVSRETILALVFQLCRSAERKWRCLNSPHLLGEVIEGVQFVDGVKADGKAA